MWRSRPPQLRRKRLWLEKGQKITGPRPCEARSWSCDFLGKSLTGGQERHGVAQLGKAVDDVVGRHIGMLLAAILRGPENGAQAQLLRPENIVVHVVADEDGLLGLHVQRL